MLLLLLACKDPASEKPPVGEDSPILAVPETERWEVAGMACDAHVVRTAGMVPHIYARDREDLARAYGFTQARDRYFEMELARRLGLGEVAQLLGDDALAADMESRATGMTWVAHNLHDHLTAEQAAIFDAYAEGINAYLALVRAGTFPLPSELALAGPFLGVSDPVDLLEDWDRLDVAGVSAVLVYQLGYETDDVGRAATDAAIRAGLFDTGDPLGALRQAGVEQDIWARYTPTWPAQSTSGWGLNGAGASARRSAARSGRAPRAESGMVARAAARLAGFEDRLGRGDYEAGWGSNVWAVGGDRTADGSALVAGDGHLPLSVPSLFWQVGLDTSVLGGGDTHQVGLGIPGLPILAVGTNGQVAWSQTQLYGDITDWYAEELKVEGGVPVASRFQGAWEPLTAVVETHVVADVPLLGSKGRTVEWTRYLTFDGRWIADVEGSEVPMGTAGSVTLPGVGVVPEDVDGDGVISAVSFDYTAFSDGNLLNAVDRFGHAANVEELREATRYLVAYSQNIGAADASGSVLYTGYQAVPCRGYLPRDEDGNWLPGADPRLLLDGTTYGGFTIPVDAEGRVDESHAEAEACVVPWADYPAALDPEAGFVVNANNDPAGLTLDGDLLNEPWYIGGPWTEGWRAQRITERLEALDGTADVAAMASIQADRQSAMGLLFGPHLVSSIQAARAASPEEEGSPGRMAAIYQADAAAFDEVEARLGAWLARGAEAESGVATFYHSPDADQVDDSVATMLFNAWLVHWYDRVFGDEALPSVWSPSTTAARLRTLDLMIRGRGADNPLGLASWNPDTGESVFFDDQGTEDLETSSEVAVRALADALAFLRSPPDDELRGSGFGSDTIADWKWGLRHWTRFESVLADFVDAEEYGFLTEPFSISTDVLPLQGEPGTEDLPWFPRPGDNLAVDAANFGWSTDFTYSSGPVFRMVIALGPDGVSGQNVLPGGQSGLTDSPYFADQAALWLGNETLPVLFAVEDVVAAALGRERLVGAGCGE